jgi:hypothetical protein
MVLVNSDFEHANKFLLKLLAITARTSKSVRQSCPRPKNFKEYRFEGRQITSQPRALTFLEPALVRNDIG